MSRYADGSYDAAGWDDERKVYPDGPTDALWFAITGESPLELVRDVELGLRVSERLDCFEDVDDVRWFAEQAQLEAAAR